MVYHSLPDEIYLLHPVTTSPSYMLCTEQAAICHDDRYFIYRYFIFSPLFQGTKYMGQLVRPILLQEQFCVPIRVCNAAVT